MSESLTAASLADPPPHARRVARPADLVDLFLPDVEMCVLARSPEAAIAGYLDRAAALGRLGSGTRFTVRAGERVRLLALPELPGRDALEEDVRFAAELLADLVGCDALGIRIEVTDRASCPRLHVDRVAVRLLCTYRGDGTQWLDHGDADRAHLGGRGADDAHSGLLREGATLHSVPPFALALLKGSAWPGHESRGVIHRSPGVAAESGPRVLLAIDPLWQ